VSSPASATFLAAWRQLHAGRVLLAKVEMAQPSAQTLYLSTRGMVDSNSVYWEPFIIDAESVTDATEWLSTGPDAVSTSLLLARRRSVTQASGDIADYLNSHYVEGAVVTLYLWESHLTSATDMLQVFKGTVNRVRSDRSTVTLYLIQDRSWMRPLPTVYIDKATYPSAPTSNDGLPAPIVYGSFRAPGMTNPPWANAGGIYQEKADAENCGAGYGVVPGILVDSGVGDEKVKVLYASHAVSELMDRDSGYSHFLVGTDRLSPLDTDGVTEINTADEAAITVDDGTMVAYCGALPIDIRTDTSYTNSAANPRNALDPFDDTTYATLDQSASQNVLRLILPCGPNLGTIISVTPHVAWARTAGTDRLRMYYYNPVTGNAEASSDYFTGSTTPAVYAGASHDNWMTNWQFGGDGSTDPDFGTIDLAVDFEAGTDNAARIYFVALVVKYRPNRTMVTPAAVEGTYTPQVDLQGRQVSGTKNQQTYGTYGSREVSPAIYKLDGAFYANIDGYADDGSGTYTGSAAALIEKPPDIARHMLATYGGMSAANDFETGAGVFGSFVDARTSLRAGCWGDYELACHIASKTNCRNVLAAIAEQSMAHIWRDRFDNKWRFLPWVSAERANYDLTIHRDDVFDFSAELQSDLWVRQAIRVRYGMDYFRNSARWESFVTPRGSSQGYYDADVRDQRMTVVAGVNDALDWTLDGDTYAETLATGAMTPIALAEVIQAKAVARGVTDLGVSHGFSIKSDFNDTMRVEIDSTWYTATIAEGDYATPDDLCVAVEVALSAAYSGYSWACAYNYSTGKFTVTATGGEFAVDPAPATDGGWFALGVSTVRLLATYALADHARWLDIFSFSSTSTDFSLLFSSGTSAAMSCRTLLGYAAADTTTGKVCAGTMMRGNREALAATSATYWSEKEEQAINADFIRQQVVAALYRNRRFDLVSQPRVVVSFSTLKCPDLQRGRVFSFGDDLDSTYAYPGPGRGNSWYGRRFRVLEVSQNLVSSWHQEVVAVEVSPTGTYASSGWGWNWGGDWGN
jgi:hypothetical protein